MSDFLDRISKLSPKRLALLALEQQERIEAAERRAREPIAIVGMSCRYAAGADSLAGYWDLLASGRDASREVPRDRWDVDAYFDPDPDAPARMSTRNGGFLADVGSFDAAFFGISPREALSMDPQQRLLLQVAWEAFEDAAIPVESLSGSATGVFVGICNLDYFTRLLSRGNEAIDAYIASGSALSVAAGRIAYCFGFQGPALSIDTSCSASLVALHTACRSLRTGESNIALAAGVNVISSPHTSIGLSKARMLAPDGRCKAFDASADGFARGEGCGVLVLKRLSDARSAGDRIWGVVRGTAVNQDGRSGGLTVPNGPAQEAVIRAALADAAVAPADIDYVEAHGTGTSLGDPIEMRALANALGGGRAADDPLLVGSVKTNLGHLESAAGIAGVMKVVLALHHGRIPRHLHFNTPSPRIPWDELPIRVTSRETAWPARQRPRLAGVSSFGFSGTNAHAILEEAPASEISVSEAAATTRQLQCIAMSSRTPSGLSKLAARYADALTTTADDSLSSFARVAGAGRSHLSERAAVVAATSADAVAGMRALQAGISHQSLHRATAVPGQVPETVFLYTGQGSQYPGMSRQLYDTLPVFREVIDRCAQLLGPDAQGHTLQAVLWELDGEHPPIHQTAWTQPALFAVEYALTQVWRSWGIHPAAVLGHSVGEYVAACVAGVFTLEEGLALIAERGRLMQSLPAGGAMAALFAPESEVATAIAPFQDRVAIAAVNAPENTVISGDAAVVASLIEQFTRRNVRAQRLQVSLAMHSPLVTPVLEPMYACAARVQMRAPTIPVAWNLTAGKPLPSGGAPDANYWRRHLREPVRFAASVAHLYAEGHRTFLEVGPHPTLLALVQQSVPEDAVCLASSLRRGKDDWAEMLGGVATLYTRGAAIDWAALCGPAGRRHCEVPSYSFETQRFWPEPAALVGNPAEPPDPDLFYEVSWEERPAPITAVTAKPGRAWTIVGDVNGLGASLAQHLRARGDTVTQLAADATGARLTPDGELVYLGALELATRAAEDADAASACELLGCQEPLRWLSLAANQDRPVRAWLVTRGAQVVASESSPGARWQAPLWGVGRVFALEQPERWGGLIDLAPDAGGADEAAGLLAAIDCADIEDQIAFRGGKRFVARLYRDHLPTRDPVRFREDATYLIVGGFGGLGQVVARWMARNGARHLALLGRKPDQASSGVKELRAQGVNVIALAGDVADESVMREHISRLAREAPPLRGIMQGALAFTPAPISAVTADQIHETLRPKVHGTVLLEKLTRSLELDFFVMFSSTAAVTGAFGMAHYAAANAFQEATACAFNRPGRHVLTVSWGAWDTMRLASEEVQRGYHKGGLKPLRSSEGLAALGNLLSRDASRAIVARIEWATFKPVYEARRVRPLFAYLGNEQVVQAPAASEPAVASAKGPGLSERFEATPEARREEFLIEFVRGEVASVLGLGEGRAVAVEKGLFDLGMDSLMTVELRRRLERALERKLPSTLTFNYPSVVALAKFLEEELGGPAARELPVAQPVPLRQTPAEPLAVAGDLDALSDTELEERLLARLSQTR